MGFLASGAESAPTGGGTEPGGEPVGPIILSVLVVLAVAAPRYGADTRTGDSWTAGRLLLPGPRRRPTPAGDLAAAARAVWGWVTARTARPADR